MEIINKFRNEYEPVPAKTLYLNEERVNLGLVGTIAIIEEAEYFSKNTTKIEISLFKYADNRCNIIDYDTEILYIERFYIRVERRSGAIFKKFRCDSCIYVNNEILPIGTKRISNDIRKALDEYLKIKEAK